MHRKGTMFVQDIVGESVVWWEYDAVLSEYDHVYDEPGLEETRAWRPSILVPVQYVNVTEAGRQNQSSGRRVANTLRLAVSVRVLRDVGLSAPQDNRRHLNDMLLYANRLWAINDYDVRGRINRDSVMVGVSATEIKSDDMPFDVLPSFNGISFGDRPTGFPSTGYADQTFNNHELPAHHE